LSTRLPGRLWVMSRQDLIDSIIKGYLGNEEDARKGFESLCILLDQYDDDLRMTDEKIAQLRADIARTKQIIKEKIIKGE